MIERYLIDQVKSDLQKKMVFVSGPRQVGKTTLAKSIIEDNCSYLSWDIPIQREQILKRELPLAKLWCFDEIHKFSDWRNYLKGIYDEFSDDHKILVTGSARLDTFRKKGDSLQGRHYHLRLHPLSVKELKVNSQQDFLDLLHLGGFPEPFFSGSEVESKRWSSQYRSLLVNQEVASIEKISDFSKLELLSIRLPELVGSPLSINSLREDLQMAHKTIKNWVNILENIYMLFQIAPIGSPLIRAVKKEQKHYHYDWTLVKNEAYRFENMVACHLLKWCQYQQDVLGENIELRYFRDTDKREVDFCITKDQTPVQFIECKWNDGQISSHLNYLQKKFPSASFYQITAVGKKEFKTKNNIIHCRALKFLQNFI